MRKIDSLIIHCTATPRGRHVTVSDIDSWHRARGYDSIGYHYLVYLDGTVHAGRPEERVGAHCRGHNSHSIGIAYIGGTEADGTPADTRTPAQVRALRGCVAGLLERYPGARVYGHRDFAAKACPCFDAQAEYADLTLHLREDCGGKGQGVDQHEHGRESQHGVEPSARA